MADLYHATLQVVLSSWHPALLRAAPDQYLQLLAMCLWSFVFRHTVLLLLVL